jgi:hypothetical protein
MWMKLSSLNYVAGYLLHNDYSERAFQLERSGQWVKGKRAAIHLHRLAISCNTRRNS